MSAAVIILGAGGHGRVVAEALIASGVELLGFSDADAGKWGVSINGHLVLGGDEVLSRYTPRALLLANGIGSASSLDARRRIFEHLRLAGFRFTTVVHPRAIVSPKAVLEEGAQIMAGAVVQANAIVGMNAIVNTGALVDHDCVIRNHCHVGPGAALCGGVQVGQMTLIGAGATVIPMVSLGEGCLIAAGSTVVKNVASNLRVSGTPATEMRHA